MSPLQALTVDPQTTMAEASEARFVAIGGSLRPNSLTYQALEVARREFEKLGTPLHILDLRQMKLPFVDGSESYADYPDVAVLRATMKRADGIILASPEYHGGISGSLKNALDLLSFEQLEGKVFGLISVLGGESNSNTLNQMRLIVRWVHGWVIPEQIAIGRAWNAFDEQGNLKDEKLQQRFQHFVQSLVTHTHKLRGIPVVKPSHN
ncbi:NADPH-dependent FMN reductase [Synechococcus sp. R50.1]|jgi:FMN reductase|uniref:NADPH-dependent FMN reductase n=2 Tax=Synechococcus TaxID=1129 RepID=UPI0039C15C94